MKKYKYILQKEKKITLIIDSINETMNKIRIFKGKILCGFD